MRIYSFEVGFYYTKWNIKSITQYLKKSDNSDLTEELYNAVEIKPSLSFLYYFHNNLLVYPIIVAQ